jgi:hypothetical protein
MVVKTLLAAKQSSFGLKANLICHTLADQGFIMFDKIGFLF